MLKKLTQTRSFWVLGLLLCLGAVFGVFIAADAVQTGYQLSGDIIQEGYESGSIYLSVFTSDPSEEGATAVLTTEYDSVGAYVLTLPEGVSGALYFVGFNDVDDNNELTEGEACQQWQLTVENNMSQDFNIDGIYSENDQQDDTGDGPKTLNISVVYEGTDIPVTDANLWVGNSTRGWSANVDSGGEQIFYVNGGNWEVYVNAPWDQETGQQAVVGWTFNGMPVTVNFVEDNDAEVKSVEVEVKQVSSLLVGRLVNSDGQPIEGHVDLRTGSGGSYGGHTQQDGIFSVNCDPGIYKLGIHFDESQYYVDEININVAETNTSQNPLDLGDIIASAKSSKITGYVKTTEGVAIANFRLSSHAVNDNGWANVQTNDAGYYEMYVNPGTWEINIENGPDSSGYILASERLRVSITEDNQTIDSQNIILQAADANIVAQARDENGQLVSVNGYVMCFEGESLNMMGGGGMAQEFGGGMMNGEATIAVIGGKTYTCQMNTPPDQNNYTVDSSVTVSLAIGQTSSTEFLLMENDASISGFMYDQDGNKLTGINGEVFVMDENFQWRGTSLNNDGSYELSVLGGNKYALGYNFWGQTEFLQTHPDEENRFLVANGENITKDIVAPKAEAYINGVVFAPNGEPVPFAWVGADNHYLFDGGRQGGMMAGASYNKPISSGTDTNANGEFRIPIIAGEFKVFTGMPGWMNDLQYMPPEELTVDISKGESLDVTLQFSQADSTIFGAVEFEDGSQVDFGFCHAWSEDGRFSGGELMAGEYTIPLVAGTWHLGCDTKSLDGFYRSDEEIVTVVAGDNVEEKLIMREANFEMPESFTKTFSATTQTVINLPDGTVLNIPANALATEGNVMVVAEPNANLYYTSTSKPLTFAWNFTAYDSDNSEISEFNSNITIKIPYDYEMLVDMGLNEEDITAKYFDEANTTWQIPTSVAIDTENSVIMVTTNHFTNYALTTGATISAEDEAVVALGIVLTPASAGGPNVRVLDTNGEQVSSFMAYQSNLHGEFKAIQADIDGDGVNEIITSVGASFGPNVRAFELDGTLIDWFFAYDEQFRGGVNIITGDFDNDGIAEIVTAPASLGGPNVRVYELNSGAFELVDWFMAYDEDFHGGVNLAIGDVTGDGTLDIVTAPASNGGPNVRIFTETDEGIELVDWFMAYQEEFRGGVNLAVADLDGDGTAEIITLPASAGGPNMRAYTYNDSGFSLLDWTMVYQADFRGGINVTSGDLDGNGTDEVIVAPKSNGGPNVRIYQYKDDALDLYDWFMAYDEDFRGGVSVKALDYDQDGNAEVVTGPYHGTPNVRVYDLDSGEAELADWFWGFAEAFTGGVNIN